MLIRIEPVLRFIWLFLSPGCTALSCLDMVPLCSAITIKSIGDRVAVDYAPETVQKATHSPRKQNTTSAHRLMLLVDSKARDTDLNKAVRRLRMQGQHELLVSCLVPA